MIPVGFNCQTVIRAILSKFPRLTPGILILRKMNAAHSDAVPVMHSTPRGALLVAAEPPPGPIDFGALMRRQRDEE